MDKFEYYWNNVRERCQLREEIFPIEKTKMFDHIKSIRKAEKYCRKRRDKRIWYRKLNREVQNNWSEQNGSDFRIVRGVITDAS